MAMPKPVSRKLEDVLGDDIGGVMVEWLDELEETNRGTRTELAGLRSDLEALGAELRLADAKIAAEMRVGFANVEREIAKVGERSAQQIADTFKWVVPVWIASLGAVIGVMTWLLRGPR